MAPMLDALGREFNLAPEIDHPMRSLETFFLESVDRARRSQPEPSGVAAAAGVAPFLAGKGGAREDVLSKLVASPSQPAASAPGRPMETGAEKELRPGAPTRRPPAGRGFIGLCRTDAENWRRHASLRASVRRKTGT